MPGSVAPLAICSSEASLRMASMSVSSATTRPGTRMPRSLSCGTRQRYSDTRSKRMWLLYGHELDARSRRAARTRGGRGRRHKGLRLLRLAIDTHLITSHHLLPLLIEEPGGLLIEVTDGTAEYNASRYRISVFYDLAKVAVNRLAFSQGHELKAHGATAIALTPGWLRSEMMLDAYRVSEANWREALDRTGDGGPRAPASFSLSESPRYVGRAVAALAADPDRARWNQQSVSSAQLAREYGFTDADGSQPDIWDSLESD